MARLETKKTAVANWDQGSGAVRRRNFDNEWLLLSAESVQRAETEATLRDHAK